MKFLMTAGVMMLAASSVFAFDQAAAEAKVKAEVAKIEANAVIMDAIKAANAANGGMDGGAISKADEAWKAEAKGAAKPTIDAMLGNAASKELKAIVEASGGQFTELFVMDSKGLNVAMSDATSDYWQGDEDKFNKSFGMNGFFADQVEFDESAKSFNVQMSSVLKDADGKAVGAVTFGVNAK